jgi:hypothetical protein
MELTPLEADLLGDMAQDDYELFEIFQFVRHHHGHHEARVRSIGRGLLASWIARGWLGLAQSDPGVGPANAVSDIRVVLTLVDRAGTLGAKFPGADTRLRLTEQARADVEWLGPAT